MLNSNFYKNNKSFKNSVDQVKIEGPVAASKLALSEVSDSPQILPLKAVLKKQRSQKFFEEVEQEISKSSPSPG